MDLRHLRTFVTVAEQGTVSKACAAPAHRAARPVAPDRRPRGGARRQAVRPGAPPAGADERRRAIARRLPHGPRRGRARSASARNGCGAATAASCGWRRRRRRSKASFPRFLHRYAERRPKVQIKLTEAVGADLLAMLERGEIHVTVSLIQPRVKADNRVHRKLSSCRRSSFLLRHPTSLEGRQRPATVDIGRLASYPLLLLRLQLLRSHDIRCGVPPRRRQTRHLHREPHARMRCWRWPRPDTAWRSCLPSCRRIAIGCGSRASRTGASRCGRRSLSSGTSGARFRLTPRIFAKRLPRTCARSFRSRGRPTRNPARRATAPA